ncbi:hypothetical protein CF328_g9100, partial [Tilletia controversa]
SVASAATLGIKPPLAPVSSPLRSEGLKTLLERYNLLSAFLELMEGLEKGFNFGIPPITVTRTPPNHKSATSDLKTLNSAIEKEIGLGRACGPYTKEEVEDLIGPFQTSPLGLVPKPNGKWRMVQDFSYPRKGDYPAINNYIASDEFVCAWHGYWDFVDLARFMPPGSLAAMADASEAFRAVGAAKDQWPGLVILAPSGWFIIDTRLPFGLASATGVWGSVADATLAIIHAHFDTEVGLRAVKWVDDFVFMKPPSSDLLLDHVLAVTEPLGFPWHPEKRSEFASEVRYLGFEFNVHTFVVQLPEDKAAKYRERVLPFTKSGHVRLKDVERVFGCLQHIIIMARDLGPHLADFAEFLGVFDREDLFQHRFIPARVQDEAKVWLKALGSPLRRSFAAPGPPFPHDIFVDASTEWGIGITSGERWAAFKFRPGWQQESRQILWAEAVALEFGLLVAIEMGGAGHSILIHSDNQGVIGAFRFGRCRGR